jgi:hypothetical protein
MFVRGAVHRSLVAAVLIAMPLVAGCGGGGDEDEDEAVVGNAPGGDVAAIAEPVIERTDAAGPPAPVTDPDVEAPAPATPVTLEAFHRHAMSLLEEHERTVMQLEALAQRRGDEDLTRRLDQAKGKLGEARNQLEHLLDAEAKEAEAMRATVTDRLDEVGVLLESAIRDRISSGQPDASRS